MNINSTKLRASFYSFMQVQLFLSLISLPVLVAWGLPFSVTTVVGNLLFTPLLSVFLLCCACIFFLELLNLPNSVPIFILEKLFSVWMYCLSFGSPSWLYGIDSYGIYISLICAVAAFFILHHKMLGKPKNSWYLLALLLAAPFVYQKISSFFPKQGAVQCLKKTALFSTNKGLVSITDKGALGEKQSAGTWIQYNFLSEILTKCGSVHFDTITTFHPTKRTLDALDALCNHASIKKIIISHPFKKSSDYKKAWNSLVKTAYARHVCLQDISFSACTQQQQV